MVKLTQSLEHWLFVNHREILPLIMLYLKGGSKYKEV